MINLRECGWCEALGDVYGPQLRAMDIFSTGLPRNRLCGVHARNQVFMHTIILVGVGGSRSWLSDLRWFAVYMDLGSASNGLGRGRMANCTVGTTLFCDLLISVGTHDLGA